MTKLFYNITAALIIFTLISQPVLAMQEDCDLVSSDYITLISSVKALEEQLNLVPKECVTSAGTSNPIAGMDDLRNSTTKLHEYWNNQALASQDPTQFGQTLNTALQSINVIGANIKNSALNPACAAFQKQDGLATVVSKVSDVFSAIAPIAMMASVFIPALAVVNKGTMLAGMMGLTAVSSIASTASELVKADILSMKNPAHRKLVLKGICEFRKIKQNVDYINYINSGQARIETEIEKVTQRKEELKERFKKENPKLAPLVDKYFNKRQQIEDEEKKISRSRVAMGKIEFALSTMSDKFSQCGIVYTVVKNNTIFQPLKMPSAVQAIDLDSLTVSSLATPHLIAAVIENQKKIITEKEVGKQPNIDACFLEVEKWRKNAPQLLAAMSVSNRDEVGSLVKSLKEEPEFIIWVKKNYGIEKERQLLERIHGFMGASRVAGSIIAEADLNLQIADLQKLLLGKGVSRIYLPVKSLAGGWISHMETSYDDGLKKFNSGFMRLNFDINNRVARSVIRDPKDREGMLYRSQIMSLQSKQDLELINSKIIDPNRDKSLWENSCLQLSELEALAGETELYYRNIKFLCDFMEKQNLKRPFVDDYIIEMCWGDIGVQVNKRQSFMQKIEAKSNEPLSLKSRTGLVKRKIFDLKCPEPKKPGI